MKNIDQLKINVRNYFETTITVVFSIMLFFLMLGIIIGVVKLFLHLDVPLSSSAVTGTYKIIISDVLSLFILIELSRSLAEYFNSKRLRTAYILDAVMVFVLREIMIKLFEHTITTEEILALSALLLTLGVLRFMANHSFHRENMENNIAS
jgi:uncharacterized membrane protein (DUF373 family)